MMKINRITSRVIFLVGILLVVLSCDWPLSGVPAYSDSVTESKERNVFVQEYFIPDNAYKLSDSLILRIDEIWIEKVWRYGDKESITLGRSGDGYPYQLLITLKDELEINSGYSGSWIFADSLGNYIRYVTKKKLIYDCKKSKLNSDKIVLNVYEDFKWGQITDAKTSDRISIYKKED